MSDAHAPASRLRSASLGLLLVAILVSPSNQALAVMPKIADCGFAETMFSAAGLDPPWTVGSCCLAPWATCQNISNVLRVISMDLTGTDFMGTLIPAGVANAAELQTLTLPRCNLSGVVPPLPGGLLVLNLSNNRLAGSVTFVQTLPNLTSLDISSNAFTGSVPKVTTTKLLTVNLSSNQLEGYLPISSLIGSSPSYLQTLDVSNNPLLSGSVNDIHTSKSVTLLTTINIANTSIGGMFPDSLSLTPFLRNLRISNTLISGSLPILPNSTQVFEARNLNMNGSFANLLTTTQLQAVDISGNQFNDVFDPSTKPLGNLKNLVSLNISSNLFSGRLNIANSSALRTFDMSNNKLSGNVDGLLPGNLTLCSLGGNDLYSCATPVPKICGSVRTYCPAPVNGTCTVSPSSGNTSTAFYIKCDGWSTEDLNPLLYEYSWQSLAMRTSFPTVAANPPTFGPFSLPVAGNPIVLTVRISRSDGGLAIESQMNVVVSSVTIAPVLAPTPAPAPPSQQSISNSLDVIRALATNVTSNLDQILQGVSSVATDLGTLQNNASSSVPPASVDNLKLNALGLLSNAILDQQNGTDINNALVASSAVLPKLMPSTFNGSAIVSSLLTLSKLAQATHGNGGLASAGAAANLLECLDKVWSITENVTDSNMTLVANKTRFDVVGSNVSFALLGAIQNLAKAVADGNQEGNTTKVNSSLFYITAHKVYQRQVPASLESGDGAVVANLDASLPQILNGGQTTNSSGYQLHLISMRKNPFDNSVGASLR
ncbi:L domain-like protein [Gonapodya prolifera JEL478]|uniref:L domain-like protein n=1 Tax=Gonapodya prolifera (strain JEL478) TaxID=1344416 RepID=A0A139AV13_GONPJ|nr:L domain-like protein [Gonapodya prolifera JEL478]|eukprot:KXS20423.1 L domain-like protein [Gonapodya prolifera JEL478]